MKKIIFLWSVVLLIISMTLVGYAKMEKTAISKGNLADLKGKWLGTRTFGPGRDLNTDLEILNDTLPVQTKFTLYDVQKPGARQRGETVTTEFKNGKINDQGNLFIEGSNIEIELSLFEEDGKKKLEGNYFWKGVKGTMSFKKK
jgi:hypothetical protein